MAPNMAPLFASYLASELNQMFNGFALDPYKDCSEWIDYVDENVDAVIDRVMERMFTESRRREGREQDLIYGDAE